MTNELKMAEEHIKLLSPDPDRLPSVIENIWGPTLGAVMGFGAVCIVNFGTRRPVFSGIQRHVLLATAGAIFGNICEKNRTIHFAERDAALRHYIELHPEDYPVPERKKWSEVIIPWVPIR